MLKFRLPWKDGITKYLKGKIYLPVWGRQTTTETRLVIDKNIDFLNYDNKKYEEQMFYFNTVTRVQYYEHNLAGIDEYDHCYDCAAENYILTNYLLKSKKNIDEKNIIKEIRYLSKKITKLISYSRTITTNIDVNTRNTWFIPRLYDIENKKIKEIHPNNNKNKFEEKNKKLK